MDELIGLALQAAARSAGGQPAGPQRVNTSAQRYQEMLAAMRDREGTANSAVPAVVTVTPQPVPVRAKPTTPPIAKVASVTPPSAGLGEMFRDGKSLLRAVIAAEVLGPPRALQESLYWRTSRPNDPFNSPD